MSYAQELADIEGRFLANWTTTPVAVDEGVIIDPVSKAIVAQPDAAAWVRITVRGAQEQQASLGGAATTQYRNSGVIMISIFTPTRSGHAAGRALADTAGAIFRGQQFGGITCRAASINELGKIDGGWFQTNVDLAFFRDAFH